MSRVFLSKFCYTSILYAMMHWNYLVQSWVTYRLTRSSLSKIVHVFIDTNRANKLETNSSILIISVKYWKMQKKKKTCKLLRRDKHNNLSRKMHEIIFTISFHTKSCVTASNNILCNHCKWFCIFYSFSPSHPNHSLLFTSPSSSLSAHYCQPP